MTAQTLFALAGLAPTPARLPAALVLIDCQYEYLDGRLALPGIAGPLANHRPTLGGGAGRRRAGDPCGASRQGGRFDRDRRGGAFIDAVAPIAGLSSWKRTFANAFAGTDLAAHLPDGGPIVLVGFAAYNCISSSTARAAVERGFLPTIIGEACATRDLPDGRRRGAGGCRASDGTGGAGRPACGGGAGGGGDGVTW